MDVIAFVGASADASTRIVECLQAALRLTEVALRAELTDDLVLRLAAERAPMLEAAEHGRASGVVCGEVEAELAKRIVALDAELLARVWSASADSFGWLEKRTPGSTALFPELAELHRRPVALTPANAPQADLPQRRAPLANVERYSKATAAR